MKTTSAIEHTKLLYIRYIFSFTTNLDSTRKLNYNEQYDLRGM